MTPCKDCPIKGNRVLPQGKPDGKEIHASGKKNELRDAMDRVQTAFKEADQ